MQAKVVDNCVADNCGKCGYHNFLVFEFQLFASKSFAKISLYARVYYKFFWYLSFRGKNWKMQKV